MEREIIFKYKSNDLRKDGNQYIPPYFEIHYGSVGEYILIKNKEGTINNTVRIHKDFWNHFIGVCRDIYDLIIEEGDDYPVG